MQMDKLILWAKEVKSESREQRAKYRPIYLSKIDAYVDMIIARAEILTANAVKGQRYMEEIEDGLTKLASYGVKTPNQPKETKVTENPLRP